MDTRDFNNRDIDTIIEDILEDYTKEEEILTHIIRNEICEVYVEKKTFDIEKDIIFQHSIPY